MLVVCPVSRYIHMLGVAPEHQCKGVGRMLMRIISALADQDAYPVHLEVSGSRNRAYFEQCGFRTMETIDVCSEVRRPHLCKPSFLDFKALPVFSAAPSPQDSPTLKICLMTRVPFPKLIELE